MVSETKGVKAQDKSKGWKLKTNKQGRALRNYGEEGHFSLVVLPESCREEGHFIGVCPKPIENMAFVRGAWSDSEDGDEPQNDATCLMAVDSQEVCLKCNLQSDD
ncbi:hypothetical protein Tco_0572582 [Tanacetum coccineum]